MRINGEHYFQSRLIPAFVGNDPSTPWPAFVPAIRVIAASTEEDDKGSEGRAGEPPARQLVERLKHQRRTELIDGAEYIDTAAAGSFDLLLDTQVAMQRMRGLGAS